MERVRKLVMSNTAAESAVSDLNLMTIREVSEVLAIHKNSVVRLINRGLLPALKVGGVLRVPRSALEVYMSQAAV